MTREEIRSKIVEFLKTRIEVNHQGKPYGMQIGNFRDLFKGEYPEHGIDKANMSNVIAEIVNDFMRVGVIRYGEHGSLDGGSLNMLVTSYGKKVLGTEDRLPHDPDGYVEELKRRIPTIDDITLSYISEAVATYNDHHLLSSTITIGAASENLILNLIEAHYNSIPTGQRKTKYEKKLNTWKILTKYRAFKNEFQVDVKARAIPFNLTRDWETSLDSIFNFIRMNRNAAGHPKGVAPMATMVYGNLQMFAGYAKFVVDLTEGLTAPSSPPTQQTPTV